MERNEGSRAGYRVQVLQRKESMMAAIFQRMGERNHDGLARLQPSAAGAVRRWRSRMAALACLLVACEASNAVLPKSDSAGTGAVLPTSMGAPQGVATSGSSAAPLAGIGPAAAAAGRLGGAAGATAAAGAAGASAGTGAAGVSSPSSPSSNSGGSVAPAAGSPGPSDAANAPAAAAAGDCRPAEHVRASLLTISLKWDDSLGIVGGSGEFYVWSRIQVTMNGTTGVTQTQPCGSQLPILTTTAVAGSVKVLAEIPFTAYENPAMPKISGTLTKEGSMLAVDPGLFLMGLQMTDPEGPWPTIEQVPQIMGVDADGDGKPGITSVPRSTPGFTLSPTSILQTKYADGVYGVQRFAFTAVASDEGCPEVVMGTANVRYYDTRVIGCHIQGGGECAADEVTFINQARPPQTAAMQGKWASKVLPVDATCADVRAALPVPAQ